MQKIKSTTTGLDPPVSLVPDEPSGVSPLPLGIGIAAGVVVVILILAVVVVLFVAKRRRDKFVYYGKYW